MKGIDISISVLEGEIMSIAKNVKYCILILNTFLTKGKFSIVLKSKLVWGKLYHKK